MKLPGFFSTAFERMGALVASVAGIVKRAMKRAGKLASGLAGKAPVSRYPVVVMAALAAVMAVLLMAMGALTARRGEAAAAAQAQGALDNAQFLREFIVPGRSPGEMPFPLARPPKSRYTEADAARVRPGGADINLEEAIERRKAELQALYEAVH